MKEQEPLLPLRPGERLHAARRSRGLTRSDVAALLKCREALVAAIEAGEPSGLAAVYQRGFIKAYMRLLDIPESESETLLANTPTADTPLQPVFQGKPASSPFDRWVRTASYLLATLLVGTLAWQITHEVVRLSQPDHRTVGGTPLPESGARAAGTQTGEHVNASIAAFERLPALHGERRHETAGQQAWQALERARDGLADGEFLIGVSTSADSWVEIHDARGERLEHDLLRGGESRQYRGFGPFRITLGRTSAVQFTVNGQVLDLLPHARDDVTQMLLDPDALLDAVETARGPD